MGQAKRRGSRDQRVAERLGLIERSLDDIKKETGIPSEARFLGYGLHLEASDEFLALLEDLPDVLKKGWVKDPQNAKVFASIREAFDATRLCEGACVVGLFDTAEQTWVAFVSGGAK